VTSDGLSYAVRIARRTRKDLMVGSGWVVLGADWMMKRVHAYGEYKGISIYIIAYARIIVYKICRPGMYRS
jgi:hypothetical protein